MSLRPLPRNSAPLPGGIRVTPDSGASLLDNHRASPGAACRVPQRIVISRYDETILTTRAAIATVYGSHSAPVWPATTSEITTAAVFIAFAGLDQFQV